MEDINHNAASGNISVYMAMSNACAIEFGRIRMPKSRSSSRTYMITMTEKITTC